MAERRQMGFWDPFNNWWRIQLDKTNKRPNVQQMKEWYDEHAVNIWGSSAPTWDETKKHSKGMRRLNEISVYFKEYRKQKRQKLLQRESQEAEKTDSSLEAISYLDVDNYGPDGSIGNVERILLNRSASEISIRRDALYQRNLYPLHSISDAHVYHTVTPSSNDGNSMLNGCNKQTDCSWEETFQQMNRRSLDRGFVLYDPSNSHLGNDPMAASKVFFPNPSGSALHHPASTHGFLPLSDVATALSQSPFSALGALPAGDFSSFASGPFPIQVGAPEATLTAHLGSNINPHEVRHLTGGEQADNFDGAANNSVDNNSSNSSGDNKEGLLRNPIDRTNSLSRVQHLYLGWACDSIMESGGGLPAPQRQANSGVSGLVQNSHLYTLSNPSPMAQTGNSAESSRGARISSAFPPTMQQQQQHLEQHILQNLQVAKAAAAAQQAEIAAFANLTAQMLRGGQDHLLCSDGRLCRLPGLGNDGSAADCGSNGNGMDMDMGLSGIGLCLPLAAGTKAPSHDTWSASTAQVGDDSLCFLDDARHLALSRNNPMNASEGALAAGSAGTNACLALQPGYQTALMNCITAGDLQTQAQAQAHLMSGLQTDFPSQVMEFPAASRASQAASAASLANNLYNTAPMFLYDRPSELLIGGLGAFGGPNGVAAANAAVSTEKAGYTRGLSSWLRAPFKGPGHDFCDFAANGDPMAFADVNANANSLLQLPGGGPGEGQGPDNCQTAVPLSRPRPSPVLLSDYTGTAVAASTTAAAPSALKSQLSSSALQNVLHWCSDKVLHKFSSKPHTPNPAPARGKRGRGQGSHPRNLVSPSAFPKQALAEQMRPFADGALASLARRTARGMAARNNNRHSPGPQPPLGVFAPQAQFPSLSHEVPPKAGSPFPLEAREGEDLQTGLLKSPPGKARKEVEEAAFNHLLLDGGGDVYLIGACNSQDVPASPWSLEDQLSRNPGIAMDMGVIPEAETEQVPGDGLDSAWPFRQDACVDADVAGADVAAHHHGSVAHGHPENHAGAKEVSVDLVLPTPFVGRGMQALVMKEFDDCLEVLAQRGGGKDAVGDRTGVADTGVADASSLPPFFAPPGFIGSAASGARPSNGNGSSLIKKLSSKMSSWNLFKSVSSLKAQGLHASD